MRYIPHTPEDQQAMLETIGVKSIDELFQTIPENLRIRELLDIPEPVSEHDIKLRLETLARSNADPSSIASFAGAGIYNHYIPSAVDHLISRSEFYTAYTPYQPEVSQGTLQGIFEFQTMIARLLGMEVSNASLYDGSTALAETVLMTKRIRRNKKPKVILAGVLHPEYVYTTRTYLERPDETLETVGVNEAGTVDLKALEAALSDDVAGVVVQHPNFYGNLEDLEAIRKLTADHGVLMAVMFSEPVAYGLIKPPGAYNADIAAGEGQSLGLPPSFGGPLLGLMTAQKQYVRAMPGRLIGQTTDRNDETCYVVTLATREQHIRRAKATSNICTNQGLCAMSSAIHMSLLGSMGLQKLGRLNHQASLVLRKELQSIDGVTLPYPTTPWFNEFVVELSKPAADVFDTLTDHGVVPGVPLSRFDGEHPNRMLVTATELTRFEEIQRLSQALRDVL